MVVIHYTFFNGAGEGGAPASTGATTFAITTLSIMARMVSASRVFHAVKLLVLILEYCYDDCNYTIIAMLSDIKQC